MPLEYTIDVANGLIYVQCAGDVSFEDIIDYERRIVDDPEFEPEFNEIFDTSPATSMDVSFDEVDNLVEFERAHARYAGKRKCAFVARSDLHFGTARMYATMAEDSPMETRVFRDLETARSWLDLPPSS